MILGSLVVCWGVASVISRDGKNSRRAYPKMNDKDERARFDQENARYGIMHNMSDKKIRKIAAYCRVRPEKNGILPMRGYQECENYVRKYLNSSKDMDKFRNAWRDYVRKCRNKKIRQNNYKYHGKYYDVYERNLRETNNYQGGEEIVIQIDHWNNLSKKEHMERMKKIQEETIFGKIVIESPILRDHATKYGAYTETWIVRGSTFDYHDTILSKQSDAESIYYASCWRLGYNPGSKKSKKGL